jgi:hypothetical protein
MIAFIQFHWSGRIHECHGKPQDTRRSGRFEKGIQVRSVTAFDFEGEEGAVV